MRTRLAWEHVSDESGDFIAAFPVTTM
ncbi:hypothetical protein A2U01_0107648, partial [Trifolium medium]|nr:hypothetical protein [Trifolium medium]